MHATSSQRHRGSGVASRWICHALAALALATVALGGAACSDDGGDDEPNEVTIVGSEYAFEITEGELKPGVNTINLRNEGAADHHMLLFPLDGGMTREEILDLVSQEEGALPEGIPWIGGVGGLAGGRGSSITVDLDEGEYMLVCVFDDGDGVTHAEKGMELTVRVEGDAVEAESPEVGVTIEASDYAFSGPETVAAGEVSIRFDNRGSETHEMLIFELPLPEGFSISDEELAAIILEEAAPPPELEVDTPFVGGISPINAGDNQIATMNLEAGTYVLLCFFPTAEGIPHVALGMLSQIQVE
jgi:hypothetical protein